MGKLNLEKQQSEYTDIWTQSLEIKYWLGFRKEKNRRNETAGMLKGFDTREKVSRGGR